MIRFLFPVFVLWGIFSGSQTAFGQTFSDTFVGLGSNTDDPIEMQMDKFELNDNSKTASLIGKVSVRQRNTVLEAAKLIVHYEGDFGKSGIERISKMVANGSVFISSGDQTATSKFAQFDMRKQILVMTGNVILTKGQNILQGERLTVRLNTGEAKLDSPAADGSGSGRVKILIIPKSLKQKKQ